MRRASGVLAALVLASCVSNVAPPGSSTSIERALSVEENQQGHAALTPASSLPMTSSPLPNTYLWCEDSSGSACLRAAAALGSLAVKNPENAPAALFDLEDLADDCIAPGIPEIRTRLDVALSLDAGGWRDQGGNRLEAASWPDIYSAAGCISDVGSPVAKIAASSSGTPRLYLVRVWETG